MSGGVHSLGARAGLQFGGYCPRAGTCALTGERRETFTSFFSSRRRHTRCSDWSSDVCSSDLHLKSTQYYLAEVFPGKAFDTPDAALYNEKWNLVLHSMLLLQEGYSYWIARRSVGQARAVGGPRAG